MLTADSTLSNNYFTVLFYPNACNQYFGTLSWYFIGDMTHCVQSCPGRPLVVWLLEILCMATCQISAVPAVSYPLLTISPWTTSLVFLEGSRGLRLSFEDLRSFFNDIRGGLYDAL